ncbi:molybdopterin molybdenumtransferase [Comamonadaceae bacterium OS-4]|nr:molybdopterin molybdenumtransferase [Comamonadaceae bacterium OS-4]
MTSAPSAPRKPLLPLDDALAQLLAAVVPLTATERVSTFDADGRVLATDVVSVLQVPAFDNSSMDGYAVHAEDLMFGSNELRVTQRIAAGAVGEHLQAGTAARIFTGAPVPPGADAVVMQEDCTRIHDERHGEPETIRVNTTPLPGQHIRHAGEDVQRGDCVLPAGTRLGPAELGLAASIGMAQLEVVRKPRVALFSTGDELVMPGTVAPQDMPPGAIYNSNRFFLLNLLRRMGCEVADLGIVPDNRAATIAALQGAAADNDVILTSGGVSVGEEDHIKPAVQSLGSLDLWQIGMKPGKPFAHGRIGAAHFIGLPGNPVSSYVTFLLLVRPFLLRLQGVRDVAMKSIAVRADFDWPKADKRREFLRVRHNSNGGLDLFSNQSSGVLTSAVWGDGLVDVAPGEPILYGQAVRFISFDGLLA